MLATGPAAHAAHDLAVDEWRALTARWLVGLARDAQAIGIQYAKDRKQFGVAVGSFQAIQHRFADLATDLDGADLLANKAIWALDVGDPVATSFPAMAFWFAGDTAQRTASWALHVHGGYGFMEEYDIQLHFRRAKAARLVLGDPRRELQALAVAPLGRPRQRPHPRVRPPAPPSARPTSPMPPAAPNETTRAASTSASARRSSSSAPRCGRSSPTTSPTRSSSGPTTPAPSTTTACTRPWPTPAGSRPGGPPSSAARAAPRWR